MKYYIIAGEASGDLHGSNLIKAMKKLQPETVVQAWGGELMEQAGAKIVKHYKDLAFMGFTEVIKNLPTIFKNIKFCKQDITSFKPDVLVLIDYPGFNMRIAKWAKKLKIKVVYYISPQIWAWKENRVHAIKRDVDKMLCILPFEKAFYKKWQFDVEYVGHPLLQVINDYKKNNPVANPISCKPIIALLPGSRQQEIKVKLPIMLQVASHFKDYDFVVAQAPSLDDDFYAPMVEHFANVKLVKEKTYTLLMQAKAALVTSGTATLETALFKVPQIVCYKGGNISYQIAKRLIKIKYISLVNLIVDKPIVKELIQKELSVENLVNELKLLLYNDEYNAAILKNYDELEDILKTNDDASMVAAKIITSL